MSATTSSELPASLDDHKFQPTEIFPDSCFFKERRASALPPPAEIKAINEKSGNIRAISFNRPPPVILPSLKLVIKYGADVPAIEAQTQRIIHKLLRNVVPVPEIFGWTEYKGQTFIYMDLVEGVTLQDRWATLMKLKDDPSARSSVIWFKHGGHFNKKGMSDTLAALAENHSTRFFFRTGQDLPDHFKAQTLFSGFKMHVESKLVPTCLLCSRITISFHLTSSWRPDQTQKWSRSMIGVRLDGIHRTGSIARQDGLGWIQIISTI
ncbi:hypothetical protein G6O67_006381 [Ophiocordyceps sinensis]|uniref:Uncharacterized protein n=1 Tax=Ophiocordyceps sinensis TaxID=72228 RepID=A0A8H4LVD0_9HYPO|nr:hypothetical protein G6O67_006381 [Ophiocordyceps sinensis]